MELKIILTRADKKEFLDFIYRIYQGNANYIDTLSFVVKSFLYQSDVFTKECRITPVQIVERLKVLAQAILIQHHLLPVLQVAFFEAERDSGTACDKLLDFARESAAKNGLKKIVVGLNGHLSYGVGFLTNCFELPISFDSNYTQNYYPDFFRLKADVVKKLSTYSFTMDKLDFNHQLIKRVNGQFSYRLMDMKRFKEEMLLFGSMCNDYLAETDYYFERDPYALYQLIKPLKPVLQPYHLIFALKDNKEIGFVFWHPDYNEIIPGGRRNSVLSIIARILFLQKRIQTFKINAIGVSKEHQNTALAMGLIAEIHKYTTGRYSGGETNFVWDSNTKSVRLNKKLAEKVCRTYEAYEFNVE